MSVTAISPRQLADLCKSGLIDLIDVRTPVEFRELHATDARNVPLDRLDPVAVTRILRQVGFAAANVSGGYKTYRLLHPEANGL
jgi:hypothetical protein